jgi:ArsR family transcriptional regulator
MEQLLSALRACAEPTRLRLLALAGSGAFCVMEFTEILGQSQPRLSRHLRLLGEAGLLDRVREGPNVWFTLPPSDTAAGSLARAVIARLAEDEPLLAADRRQAARVLAERARIASESFRSKGADWDEMRALELPAQDVEAALLSILPPRLGRLLDIGTGTGQLLQLLADRADFALGIDASKAMLALARARLAKPGLAHCTVRLADMYSLPLPNGGFDVAVLQMVLHHAEDPALAIAEAVRVLRPGGLLVVVDLAAHDRADIAQRFFHRRQGIDDATLNAIFAANGLAPARARVVPGPLAVRLWSAHAAAAAQTPADRVTA